MSETLKHILSNVPPPSADLPDRIMQRVHEMKTIERQFRGSSRWEIVTGFVICIILATTGTFVIQRYADSFVTCLLPVWEQWQTFDQEMFFSKQPPTGWLGQITLLHLATFATMLSVATLAGLFASGVGVMNHAPTDRH